MTYRTVSSRRQQHGIALVVALMFLLICTVIAIGASGRSLLQQRMVSGLRQGQLAEMAAETTLRGAEWELWNASTGTSLPCGQGSLGEHCYKYDPASAAYRAGGVVERFRRESGWLDQGGRSYLGPGNSIDYTTLAQDSARLWKNPMYLIEDLGIEQPSGITSAAHESGHSSAYRDGYSNTTRHIYRITARATGSHPHVIRVLESTFAAKGD